LKFEEFNSVNTSKKTGSKFPAIAVQILNLAIIIWMIFIVLLYLFLYTPPQIISALAKAGADKPLVQFQEKVMPFFQTIDFSAYIKKYY